MGVHGAHLAAWVVLVPGSGYHMTDCTSFLSGLVEVWFVAWIVSAWDEELN